MEKKQRTIISIAVLQMVLLIIGAMLIELAVLYKCGFDKFILFLLLGVDCIAIARFLERYDS